MKEYAQNTKQLARAIQESGRNQKVVFWDNRASPIQMGKGGAGGVRHHDPEEKKYLPSGVGKQQNEVAAVQDKIKRAEGLSITHQEAKRKAKEEVKNK